MRALTLLRDMLAPPQPVAPVEELLELAKTFTPNGSTPDGDIAKARTLDDVEDVPLHQLQVDPDYQRPPDREKISEFVRHLKAGGKLPPIKANERPDGSRWITDGQHRAAAAAILGRHTIPTHITRLPSQQEPEETGIVAKIAADADSDAMRLLRGAGARRHGKRLLLALGEGRRVEYLPHSEFVAKTERGRLRVHAPDAPRVLITLGLDDLHPEIPDADER